MIRHKFNAKRVEHDGIKFASKKEARVYEQLKLMQKSGEVLFFLLQPRFDLGAGVKYTADFIVFFASGTVEFWDAKGVKTKEFIAKKKLVENKYPVEIKVV